MHTRVKTAWQPDLKLRCWPPTLPQHQLVTTTSSTGWIIVGAGVLGPCQTADLHQCSWPTSKNPGQDSEPTTTQSQQKMNWPRASSRAPASTTGAHQWARGYGTKVREGCPATPTSVPPPQRTQPVQFAVCYGASFLNPFIQSVVDACSKAGLLKHNSKHWPQQNWIIFPTFYWKDWRISASLGNSLLIVFFWTSSILVFQSSLPLMLMPKYF